MFQATNQRPADAIFGLVTAFKADKNPKKVNLSVGAYRDHQSKPKLLETVLKVEKDLVGKHNKEYLPIAGDPEFLKAAREIMFTEELMNKIENRTTSIQTLSGTGALKLVSEYLKLFGKQDQLVYLPSPTWGNHANLLKGADVSYDYYRYYDKNTKGVDIKGLLEDLNNMPKGSIVLLHPCAHNPTGADPTLAQWSQIADVMQHNQLFPLFDTAYQGYVTGDPIADGAALRLFVERGFEMLCCQSFSKIMGLYCERVGAVHIIAAPGQNAEQEKMAVLSQLSNIARQTWSNPPAHGARIVSSIWNDKNLRSDWFVELKEMAERIDEMRIKFRNALQNCKAGGSNRSWDHVTKQRGMFCFTGITPEQADFLMQKRAIYLTRSGRVSIAGLNDSNVDYVAKSFRDALQELPAKL